MEYEVEGGTPRGRPKRTWRLCRKTVSHINWTGRMLWTVLHYICLTAFSPWQPL